MAMPKRKPSVGLVCFNNFYYCRYAVGVNVGDKRLVCFNNFYYCRSLVEHSSTEGWLVCFNNFYYCRLFHKGSINYYCSDAWKCNVLQNSYSTRVKL